jgi:SsrA-binding protein
MGKKIIAVNRKARRDYEILESLEVGMVLKGTEVKSLREGRLSFKDSYARIQAGEVFLA